MKYDCCTYNDIPQKTELLKKQLLDKKQQNTLDIELLKKCAEYITVSHNKRDRITQALKNIDSSSCELTEYNDMLVRKLIECIKVNSKTEITIIFKGGIETTVEVEK